RWPPPEAVRARRAPAGPVWLSQRRRSQGSETWETAFYARPAIIALARGGCNRRLAEGLADDNHLPASGGSLFFRNRYRSVGGLAFVCSASHFAFPPTPCSR